MSVEFLSGTNRENRIRELENFIEVFKRTNYSYQPPSYKYVSKSPTAYFEVGGKRIELIDHKIVESVYHIAYLVCKAEMFLTGTSRILSYVKTDPIVSSFMEDEIEKDIERINDEHVKTIIRDININEKSTSLLDDRVIFALSMIGDSTKIKYIEDSILDIVHLMKEFEDHINENAKEKEKIRKKISSADKKRKN